MDTMVVCLRQKQLTQKTFPQVRWNGLTHKVHFYSISIHICIMHHTFSLKRDQFFTENLSAMKRSKVVLKKSDKSESHSLLLSVLNSQKYVQTHSTSHTHIHSDLTLNAHVDNPQAQPDQRNNTFHGLWCLCIRSGQSTRFLQITFPPYALNHRNWTFFQNDERQVWKQEQEKIQHLNENCCATLSWSSRQNLVVVMGSCRKEKFKWWMDQSQMTSKSIRPCNSLSRNSWRQKDLKICCLSTQDREHGINQKIPLW